jgi:TonB family protein
MDGASAACDKAIAADPKKADAYFVKALSLFGGGKLNPEGKYIPPLGTIDALDKYLSLAPDGPHANDAKQMVAFAYSKVDISFASVGLPASSDPLSGKPFVEPEVVKENLLVFVPPAYPPLARTMRIQGDVDLQALINEHGNIEYLRVTTGQPLLYKSAIDAAKQWKYKPFLINGKPVAVSATFTVRFQMDPSK